MTQKEKATIRGKKIECLLGFFFLIPPILGVIAFVLCLWGVHSDFTQLDMLTDEWVHGGHLLNGCDGTGMSAAPIYLALMAFVGAYLIKDNIKYFFSQEDK